MVDNFCTRVHILERNHWKLEENQRNRKGSNDEAALHENNFTFLSPAPIPP